MVKRLTSARVIGFAVVAVLVGAAAHWSRSHGDVQEPQAPASTSDTSAADPSNPTPKIRVDVLRPHVGSMARSETEPGNVDAFDYAQLYCNVSGYLKVQKVDIGSLVKEGDVLAEIDAPEYIQSRDQAKAEVEQAKAKLQLANAAVVRAQADVGAAEAGVSQKKAELTRANAYLSFRAIQSERMTHLFELKSIDQRLVEESKKEREAAQAAVEATDAAINTAQTEVAAKNAKVAEARAAVDNAKANVAVAVALLQKAQVYVNYLKIVSPYTGVITERGFHVGDFIRAPEGGARQRPLLTVARTDVMRVVIKLPERYVPYCDPGDPATVELDALQGRVFHAKVSRIANSLDRADRTMRVEVDLKNTSNELRDGMFGRVTIQLTAATKELSIPSSALVTGGTPGSFSVYVVRKGRAEPTPVKVGRDNGILAEILSGLAADDLIVDHPTEDLRAGAAVEIAKVSPTDNEVVAPPKK
ncbi:MAG TPA: efflux RND transporter periplasmic adaptor subunit [Planctomycetaceae bacterium]|jgi:HlyD family secretion protein|nr:efflux RND transporter periplasmic adaptor subunit [Planctomycetaceae bacterium]